jgi:hypothetical protein
MNNSTFQDQIENDENNNIIIKKSIEHNANQFADCKKTPLSIKIVSYQRAASAQNTINDSAKANNLFYFSVNQLAHNLNTIDKSLMKQSSILNSTNQTNFHSIELKTPNDEKLSESQLQHHQQQLESYQQQQQQQAITETPLLVTKLDRKQIRINKQSRDFNVLIDQNSSDSKSNANVSSLEISFYNNNNNENNNDLLANTILYFDQQSLNKLKLESDGNDNDQTFNLDSIDELKKLANTNETIVIQPVNQAPNCIQSLLLIIKNLKNILKDQKDET